MDSLLSSTSPGTEGLSPRSKSAVSREPHLFLVLQCDRPLLPSGRFSLAGVESVSIGRGSRRVWRRGPLGGGPRSESLDRARGSSDEHLLRLEVVDSWMSSAHLRLLRALGRWVVEDAGSRNGTYLNGSPVAHAVLKDGDILEAGRTFFVYRHAIPSARDESPDLDASELDGTAPGLATLSPALAKQFDTLRHVSRSPVSVLLQGETGTGKEVLARTMHALSGRPGPFVPVNCGAIPEALVESELFGYRRGAFSGAAEDRIGLVRSADRGTLFLDEIGDLPLVSQAKFLRVLQERQVVPLGGTRPVHLDIRFCAATHRELDALRNAKQFREDLLARISGITVRLPPLRQRREDLGLLIASLLKRVAGAEAKGVSFKRRAALALLRYPWPLNVRELEKALESAVVLARGEPIDLPHLPEAIRAAVAASSSPGPERQRRQRTLVALLEEHRGNVSAVARALGKDRVQIRRWLKQFQLEAKSFRTE